MPSRHPPSRLIAGLIAVLFAARAGSDTIVLNNGRVIEADRAWYEGTQVRYEKGGGVYGLPKSLVKQLDQKARPPAVSDPDVTAARGLLAQDPAEAARLARRAVDRDPLSIGALQTLAEALLGLGDARGARDRATQALRIDDRDPQSRALLGDALLALGDRYGAEEAYRVSLRLRPDPAVERKLKQFPTALAPPARSPSVAPGAANTAPGPGAFHLRYEGGANEAVGASALRALNSAYAEYASKLGFRPEQTIDVKVEAGKSVQDPRAPAWAAGWSADGTIQVPAQGLETADASFVRVLRHELAHSFVTWRTGNNCPTWLQEGIAQWLEGGDPARRTTWASPPWPGPASFRASSPSKAPSTCFPRRRPRWRTRPASRPWPMCSTSAARAAWCASSRRWVTSSPRRRRCPWRWPSAIPSSRPAGPRPCAWPTRTPRQRRRAGNAPQSAAADERYHSTVRRSPSSNDTDGL